MHFWARVLELILFRRTTFCRIYLLFPPSKNANCVRNAQTRAAPAIRFLGVFDTVKALDDGYLYDISLTASAENSCQALAMNEQRTKFKPELWKPSAGTDDQGTETSKTFLQGWFVGAL